LPPPPPPPGPPPGPPPKLNNLKKGNKKKNKKGVSRNDMLAEIQKFKKRGLKKRKTEIKGEMYKFVDGKCIKNESINESTN